jgi:hypothetical protein
MSRTKRYVPHWVIEQHLHPWVDPETGEPHVWGSVHRRIRQKQREDARLRGDDGRCPNHNRWNNRWRNPMDEVRTAYRRQIAEGIEDHFDALEDYGKIFDFRGVDQDGDEAWYEQLAAEYEHQCYLEDLEDQRHEEEYEREMLRDYYYDDGYDDSFYF